VFNTPDYSLLLQNENALEEQNTEANVARATQLLSSIIPIKDALDCIYTKMSKKFKSMMTDNNSIMSTPDGPWFLIHHLFSNSREAGINLYKDLGGN
jgi:hypothetical protein